MVSPHGSSQICVLSILKRSARHWVMVRSGVKAYHTQRSDNGKSIHTVPNLVYWMWHSAYSQDSGIIIHDYDLGTAWKGKCMVGSRTSSFDAKMTHDLMEKTGVSPGYDIWDRGCRDNGILQPHDVPQLTRI